MGDITFYFWILPQWTPFPKRLTLATELLSDKERWFFLTVCNVSIFTIYRTSKIGFWKVKFQNQHSNAHLLFCSLLYTRKTTNYSKRMVIILRQWKSKKIKKLTRTAIKYFDFLPTKYSDSQKLHHSLLSKIDAMKKLNMHLTKYVVI